jgi:tubulin--tyrosine ligase
MLQNQWQKGACFQEIPSSFTVDDASTAEEKLRKQESSGSAQGEATARGGEWSHRHFKWAPRFTDVYESVTKAGPGSDGWAVQHGETSVTALKANFMHADGPTGELKL